MPRKAAKRKTSFGADLIEGMKVVLGLRAERDLPSGVSGPVEWAALARLAGASESHRDE